MKSQNDLIFTIVAIIIAIGALAGTYFTKPEPQTFSPPEQVVVSDPQYPAGSVTYAPSLPGSGNQGGGGGGMTASTPPPPPSGGGNSAPGPEVPRAQGLRG
ncbi:MAG: hypothetical protein HONBIEJF_01111 [Fimbriimonadaceae bacterium]|nr:hypothetical protein [Fimbriimonadaceae bacterium]